MSETETQEQPRGLQLGTLWVASPQAVVSRASEIATTLAEIVEKRKLYVVIRQRKFVRVEGWSTLGAMLGVLPREVEVLERDNGDFEATVELVRASDGAIIGRGSAICGLDEKTWANRPRYARRSMAITRATGKAFRLGFAWIIQLAGYETTPAEEMDGVIEGEVVTKRSRPQGNKPAKDKATSKPKAKAVKANTNLSPALAYLDDVKINPDIDDLGIMAFYDMVKTELPHYKATKHISNRLVKLTKGKGHWFENYTKSQLFEYLKRHAEAKHD